MKEKLLALLRLSLGWTLFWAFLDKLLGLGLATAPEKAWLEGASPTAGFLEFGTKGPLAELFQGMAGSGLVDWLFMLGLGLIGLCFILGIVMRVAACSGAVLMILMWLAALWPEHNPFMDEHIIYAFLFLYLWKAGAGNQWGLGKWWSNQTFVKNNKWMQ